MTDDLADLARALAGAARKADGETRKVVTRGAANIKADWRREWTGLRALPALPGSITWDVTRRSPAAGYEAEVGPDKERNQGALGNIIEYGSARHHPHPGGGPALQREEPRFAAAIEDMAGRLLW